MQEIKDQFALDGAQAIFNRTTPRFSTMVEPRVSGIPTGQKVVIIKKFPRGPGTDFIATRDEGGVLDFRKWRKSKPRDYNTYDDYEI